MQKLGILQQKPQRHCFTSGKSSFPNVQIHKHFQKSTPTQTHRRYVKALHTLAPFSSPAGAGTTAAAGAGLAQLLEILASNVIRAAEVEKTAASDIAVLIEQLTGISVACRDFAVHSVTVGKDAQGEVLVQVEHNGQLYRGRAVSTDSIEASAKAFLNAINRIAAIGTSKT
jgi:hypothetical protein